jgi:hypothetical protein
MEKLVIPCLYITYILFIYFKYKFPDWGILVRFKRNDYNYSLDLSKLMNHKSNSYTSEDIQKYKQKCKIKLLIHISILICIILLLLFKTFLE